MLPSLEGGFAALGVASLVISYALNWRLAFWFGAGVALVGMIARTTLRETPEFADAKRRLNKTFQQLKSIVSNIDVEHIMQDTLNIQEKTNWKTTISLLLVDCIWSVIFYFTYIHCANILKYSFHYTAEQIIYNNFIVSAILLGNMIFVLYFTNKYHPLVILKIRLILVSIYFLMIPYLLNNATTGFDILIIQSLLLFTACEASPANAIFFKHFPVFKRFTYTSAIYAASRALVYLITSVTLVYLTDYFSHWGLYFITIPTVVGCAYGLSYFIKLEKDAGNLSEKKTYVDSVANIA